MFNVTVNIYTYPLSTVLKNLNDLQLSNLLVISVDTFLWTRSCRKALFCDMNAKHAMFISKSYSVSLLILSSKVKITWPNTIEFLKLQTWLRKTEIYNWKSFIFLYWNFVPFLHIPFSISSLGIFIIFSINLMLRIY